MTNHKLTLITVLVAALISVFAIASCDKLAGNGGPLAGKGGPLKTEQDKTLYALGMMVGKNLTTFNLSDKDFGVVVQGMMDAIKNKPEKIKLQDYGPKVAVLAKERSEKRAKEEAVASKAYLEKMAKESGVQKTPTGLLYQELKAGKGESPTLADKVKVHYHGTLTGGTVFDSSRDRGEPVEFPLQGIIPCWSEGLQKMKVGGKAKLICPANLAYGEQGRPPQIPGGAALVFEVELLAITKGAPAPAGMSEVPGAAK